MPVEIEGPDGKVHTFPDGTPDEQINSQMSTMYGGPGIIKDTTPQPGDATAASGAIMPSSQSVPPYRTSEDWDSMMLSQMFPHAQQVIQNTPGHARRVEEAKVVGRNMANLEERQRAGVQVLDMLHQLGETADDGHREGNLDKAIGPLDSSPTFQRVRASIPIVGNYYEKGYNLHNQLMHDVDGLTTAFIASAAKGGITMSDARQKSFNETMGAMMKATTKEEFDKIKRDADRIIRGTFGLAPGAKVDPMRSSRGSPDVRTAPGSPQRYKNPTTGEVIEWDGTQWRKVN